MGGPRTRPARWRLDAVFGGLHPAGAVDFAFGDALKAAARSACGQSRAALCLFPACASRSVKEVGTGHVRVTLEDRGGAQLSGIAFRALALRSGEALTASGTGSGMRRAGEGGGQPCRAQG